MIVRTFQSALTSGGALLMQHGKHYRGSWAAITPPTGRGATMTLARRGKADAGMVSRESTAAAETEKTLAVHSQRFDDFGQRFDDFGKRFDDFGNRIGDMVARVGSNQGTTVALYLSLLGGLLGSLYYTGKKIDKTGDKIDKQAVDTWNKIDKQATDTGNKIDKQAADTGNKIDKLAVDTTNKFDKLGADLKGLEVRLVKLLEKKQ